MTSSCSGCLCRSPRTTAPAGRLLLATQVDHTATALRTLARRHGLALRPLAPGLLAMDTTRVEEFVALAGAELTSMEAEEVRCVVVSTLHGWVWVWDGGADRTAAWTTRLLLSVVGHRP